MKKLIVIIILISAASELWANPELAVIPYKIVNPSIDFPETAGREYAKLLGAAALIKKGILLYPMSKTDSELKELALNPQKRITEDDIIMIGNAGRADYLLAGSLKKANNSFISNSILFSIRDKRIISRTSEKSADLRKLAEQEIKSIFINFRDRKKGTETSIDIAFLVDTSFRMQNEWETVKKGIAGFSETLSGNWSTDTNVWLLPFSDEISLLKKHSPASSGPQLAEYIRDMKIYGQNSSGSLLNALDFVTLQLPWRRNASHAVLLITNSPPDKNFAYMKSGITAKKKQIAVFALSLGFFTRETADPVIQLCKMTKGQHFFISYRQRVFNAAAMPVDIFIEEDRLFHSQVSNTAWENGLLIRKKNDPENWGKPAEFVYELFPNKLRYNITPYNLAKYYPEITGEKIINQAALENNINTLLKNLGEKYIYDSSLFSQGRPLAKALISDNKLSFWIKINNEDDLKYFKEKESLNEFFNLGVIVQKNENEVYGINFNSGSYITGINEEYIPDMIKADLKNIISDPKYYMQNGIFIPPVWFIKIRVEKTEDYNRPYDIRE